MGACARNMYSDSAEIKPAHCCIKLVFHLNYTMMHGSTKLKLKKKIGSANVYDCIHYMFSLALREVFFQVHGLATLIYVFTHVSNYFSYLSAIFRVLCVQKL